MEKKYTFNDEEKEENVVRETAIPYKVNKKTSLPFYDADTLNKQAEQAISDFENGLCISHEEMKKR